MAVQQFGAELVITDKGIAVIDRAAEATEQLKYVLGGAGDEASSAAQDFAAFRDQIDSATFAQQAHKEQIDKYVEVRDRARDRDKAAVDHMRQLMEQTGKNEMSTGRLVKSVASVGQNAIQLTGNLYNLKSAYDVVASGEASMTDKMMASTGAMASAVGTVGQLSEAHAKLAPQLAKVGLKAGGAAAAVGLAAAAYAYMAAKIREARNAYAEAGTAEGQRLVTLEQNKRVLEGVAKAMGITIEKLKEQGVSLENINRLAKEDPHGKLAVGLRKYRNELETTKIDHHANALKMVAAAEADWRKRMDETVTALEKQSGVLSGMDLTHQATAVMEAWKRAEERTHDATKANALYKDEFQSVLDLAHTSGFELGQPFTDMAIRAGAATAEMKAASIDLAAHRDREAAAVKRNRDLYLETGEIGSRMMRQLAADAERVAHGTEKWRQELEALKAFSASVTIGGDGETVDVDRNDPAIKAALDRVKQQQQTSAFGEWFKSFGDQLKGGDIGGAKQLMEMMSQSGEGYSRMGYGELAGDYRAVAQTMAQILNDFTMAIERQRGASPEGAYDELAPSPRDRTTESHNRATDDTGDRRALASSFDRLSAAILNQPVEIKMDDEVIATRVARVFERGGLRLGRR